MPLDRETTKLFRMVDSRLKRGMNLRQAVMDMDKQHRKRKRAGQPISYQEIYDTIARNGYEVERTNRLKRIVEDGSP